jgi:hypothetical protein
MIRAMHRRWLASFLMPVVVLGGGLGGGLLSCAHEDLPPPQAPRVSSAETVIDAGDSLPPLRMYVLADQAGYRGSRATTVIALGGPGEGVGAILEGLRMVSSANGFRPATETVDPPIVGGLRLPAHLGGGFVFQTSSALYTSPTFDGPLRPIVTVPGQIGSISFGPQGILIRGTDGQRWYVDPRTGDTAPMNPPGLVDIASLPDGRAAAIVEFGGALVSTDAGLHWQDVTHQLPGPPSDVRVVEDELYFLTSSARSDVVRIDVGGGLVAYDKTPVVETPQLRPHDARWNDRYDAPLRHALRLGVPIDERTALVVDGGNIDTVDTMTGELVDVQTGKLPPEAACEGLRTRDDILFACTQVGGPAFVASHVLGEKPTIEITFGSDGNFFASDDGAIAFSGPCTGGGGTTTKIACARTPTGTWQEYDLTNVSDAGASADALRWVPRTDGSVVAIVEQPKLGTIDVHTGEFQAWDDSVSRYAGSLRAQNYGGAREGRVIDRVWTSSPEGGLRGWVDGGAIDVSPEGDVTVSPFKFDKSGKLVTSGAFAIATHENRLWQTVDRGSSWMEVAGPLSAKVADPTGASKRADVTPRLCSAVGCDLVDWYRIGWSPLAPAQRPSPKLAGEAPHLRAPVTPAIDCKIEGPSSVSETQRTDSSPDDLMLGLGKVPITTSSEQEHLHSVFARVLVNPPHSTDPTGDPGQDAPRALLYGYATSNDDGDRITVLGPNKDALALKRLVAFVPAFDTQQQVRKTSIGISEIVAAGRGVGLGTLDVLAEDPSIATTAVPVLGSDPAQPADLLMGGSTGMVTILRASGAHPRVTMRVKRGDDNFVTSAAAVGADDVALLEIGDDGTGHVMKWSGNGVADLFDVPPPPSNDLYPANPDAIAIGARSDIAVLRTPSGGTPPSEQDPALIYGSTGAPIALAPWSTMTLASDPACRALAALSPNDPNGGWRAILQTAGPWISIHAPGLNADPDAPTLLRVRWTQTRVCLEAAEIRLPPAKLRSQLKSDGANASPVDLDAQTWLVAKWTGTPSATRASIMLGSEMRQPLECTKP